MTYVDPNEPDFPISQNQQKQSFAPINPEERDFPDAVSIPEKSTPTFVDPNEPDFPDVIPPQQTPLTKKTEEPLNQRDLFEKGFAAGPIPIEEESKVVRSGALYGLLRGAYNINAIIPGLPELIDNVSNALGRPFGIVEKPKSISGQITAGFTQAGVGILPVAKVLQGAGYTGMTANVVSGFIGDFFTSDVGDALAIAGLVDLIDPTEKKVVSQALKNFIKKDDPEERGRGDVLFLNNVNARLVGSGPGLVLTPVAEAAIRLIGKGATKYKGTKTGEKISEMVDAVADKTNLKMKGETSIEAVKGAETIQSIEKNKLAAQVSAKETEIQQTLIDEFEDVLDVDVDGAPLRISVDVDGKKVYDPDVTRETGRKIMQQKMVATEVPIYGNPKSTFNTIEDIVGSTRATEEAGFNAYKAKIVENDFTEPLLKPEVFDKLVAIIADLKKKKPNLIKPNKLNEKGKPMRLIDQLVELTANRELLPGEELIPILNKYGLSFEDYVLSIVGTGSQAGKQLQKISQIRRVKSKADFENIANKNIIETTGSIRNWVMRVENIRRGGLVSQIATAARNLTSAYIRAPLLGIENVLDTALIRLSNEGIGAGAKALVDNQNWKGSFTHLNYMFSRPDRANSFTKYLLDREEGSEILESLFNNINEIQIATGKGKAETTVGKAFDKTASFFEGGVSALNIANRWQEFMVRKGVFFGELERLVKVHYDLDLVEDVFAKGRIQDILDDAPDLVPTQAPTFKELMSDSAIKALDVTYAKQPELQVLRGMSSFITRNGLTILLPFPRFMFNAMELMGNYVGGGSIPAVKIIKNLVENVARKSVGKDKTKFELTMKDRQRITRNLTGMAAMYASYAYVTSDESPADYKEIKLGTVDDKGIVMDTTPQFPMRQFLMLGKLGEVFLQGSGQGYGSLPIDVLYAGISDEASLKNGIANVTKWLGEGNNTRDFLQTFLGSNFRLGAGADFLQTLFAGVDDAIKGEGSGRALGSFVGNYINTILIPYAQYINFERANGIRDVEYRDAAQERGFGFTTAFKQSFQRQLTRTGIGLSPEEERELPAKVDLGSPVNPDGTIDDPRRVGLNARLYGGLSIKFQDNEDIEFLESIWYDKWSLGSRSISPEIRRFENQILQKYIPELVKETRAQEEGLRKYYREKESEANKNRQTEDAYVREKLHNYFDFALMRQKDNIAKFRNSKIKSVPFVENAITWRRTKNTFRDEALSQFRRIYNREPDYNKLDKKGIPTDLVALNKIVVKLKEAIKD